MTCLRITGLAVAVLVAVGPPAAGGPVPALTLAHLASESEVVVLGTVTSVVDAGSGSVFLGDRELAVDHRRADVSVAEVVKGPAAGATIEVAFYVSRLPYSGFRTISAGETLVLFLKRTGTKYQFASPYQPTTVSVPGARTDPAASTLERVVQAVAAAVRSADAPEPVKRSAIYALWGINTPVTIGALEGALSEPNEGLRLSALAGLLHAGHLGALATAEDVLLAPARTARGDLIQNLHAAIQSARWGAAAIPSLERLLDRGDAETKRAAAVALQRLRRR